MREYVKKKHKGVKEITKIRKVKMKEDDDMNWKSKERT